MFISSFRHLYLKLPIRLFIFPSTYSSKISHAQSSASSASSQLDKLSLNISNSCVERLNKIAPAGTFLRITVDGGGCSGFQYRFDLDSKFTEDDIIIEKEGAKVVVDNISLDFLRGSTVEYHEELIRSAFRIADNPQADSKCSCGTSFSIKGS